MRIQSQFGGARFLFMFDAVQFMQNLFDKNQKEQSHLLVYLDWN